MNRVAKVLLGYLQFGHNRGFLHGTKKWTERFSWLKIDWAILNLNNYIVAELPIEWHKFGISLFCSVFARCLINKGTPHYNTSVRFKGIGQHVCAIGMSTSKILRTRLSFTVCLNQKPSKIGYQTVNFSCLFFPPFYDFRIERIRSF